MSQYPPFDPQGRLICWECGGLTVACIAGVTANPANIGKTFYKCHLKPEPGCIKFFRWQTPDVDVLRAAHGAPDPDIPQRQETVSVPPPTTTTTAAVTRTNSLPSQAPSQPTQEAPTQLSSSQPVPATGGRARPHIDLSAPPVVTPQRHLSRQNTLDGPLAAADPPTTTTTVTPRRGRSHPEPEAEPAFEPVETVATDDEYERVVMPLDRTPTRTGGRFYPALPPSTSRRTRERMPGTYTSSSDASGPTLPTSEHERVHDWLHSPQMPERRDDVFSGPSPPPTQDTPPSLAPSTGTPSRAASTASRMHGLLRESSPSPSQGTARTVRVFEIAAPSEPDAPVDAALVADYVLRLGREAARAQALEDRVRELELQNEELRDERRDMRSLLTKMERRLEASRQRRGT